jgi:hypothetical protein
MLHLFARSTPALALLFLLSAAGPASSAQVAHISWDVTGGNFSESSWAHGPITGGRLEWTAPLGIPIETPISLDRGHWTLALTGPSGSFEIRGAGPGGIAITVNPSVAGGQFTNVFTGRSDSLVYYYGFPLFPGLAQGNFSAMLGAGSGTVAGTLVVFPCLCTFPFSHSFTLGNEVRSLSAVEAPVFTASGAVTLTALMATIAAQRRRRIRQ